MPSYNSNVQHVLGNLKEKLSKVDSVVQDKIVRTVATDLLESNRHRIHNEGKKVDGTLIGNGKYSESYAKIRRKKGRHTDKIDLSFSGKLDKEFNLEANSDGIAVGFITQYAAEVSDYLENGDRKYGKIWGVTDEDDKIAQEIAEDLIQQSLD